MKIKAIVLGLVVSGVLLLANDTQGLNEAILYKSKLTEPPLPA
ncbi:hypothetical protein HPCPY3281_0509 [Helicobacter pylori CPY3281]|nr:hypothetical protein [Helicobacter pylori]EJB15183.1 hypothetical protein HPCPY1124_1076 [Helicobacter pylori CPY1124]EJB20633.1 hypothetical protein HPCPY3281_0509 [Helicobacter pylori CPY3281]GHP25311.1 hypothetical protein JP0038_02220 [Helicobacter pylori]GHP35172.1 hypothetical protein JP0040_05580 [Helicobacter pylori]GHP66443.1 hypothetical protein JP0047_03710 [Helicobacter pylori]